MAIAWAQPRSEKRLVGSAIPDQSSTSDKSDYEWRTQKQLKEEHDPLEYSPKEGYWIEH